VAVAAGVLAVRGAVYATGDSFHADHVGSLSMWHLLDPAILRANPFAALWDVHTTPPLFNFFVGAVLAWSPLPDAISFQLLFAAGAVFSALALYAVARICGCRAWVAAVTAVLVFSDPYLIGFEAHIAHESFVVPLTMGLVWATAAYARRPAAWRFALVLVVGTVLVLTRAMFHPVWLAAVVGAVCWLRPPPLAWRRLALVVAAPFVLVAAVMVRNEVRFGAFSLSSWSGMNLERAALSTLPEARRRELVDEGVISPQGALPPFSPYEDYAPYAEPCSAHFGTPALDAPRKPGGDDVFRNANYNYACFVPVYQQAQRDAVATIRDDPGQYGRTVATNLEVYVSDPWRPWPALGGLDGGAARRLAAIHGVLDLQVQRVAVYAGVWPQHAQVQVTCVAGMLLIVALGARAVGRALRRRGSTPADVVAVVSALTVGWVTLVSITADAFENGRFRAPLVPLAYGLVFGGGLELLARMVDRRRSGDEEGSGEDVLAGRQDPVGVEL
jgi:hypothetical protein